MGASALAGEPPEAGRRMGWGLSQCVGDLQRWGEPLNQLASPWLVLQWQELRVRHSLSGQQ